MGKANKKPKVDKRLQRALDNFPMLVREQERNFKAREKDIARFAKLSKALLELQTKPTIHPWRVCPYGEHWVRTHPMRVKPSKGNPFGSSTTRHNHCSKNRSGKDHLYPEEIQEVASQNFTRVKNRPCAFDLNFPNGNDFDELIAGWVQYWNEVLKPSDPLDPNLVKALIATESKFAEKSLFNPKDSNSARGLMQINNEARKALGNSKGELKDHYVNVTKAELNDPNINICSGIRWLFNKKRLASSKLRHEASWLETVSEYKGLAKVASKRQKQLFERFLEKYEILTKCKKNSSL